MIIKLPLISWQSVENSFIYLNPEQVSAFQLKDAKSSWLWMRHGEESRYEIALLVDELEQRISNAMLDTRNMNVHADYGSMLVHLTYLDNLHDIALWIPYCFGAMAVMIVTLILIAMTIILK